MWKLTLSYGFVKIISKKSLGKNWILKKCHHSFYYLLVGAVYHHFCCCLEKTLDNS
jgi:hypothetical protein